MKRILISLLIAVLAIVALPVSSAFAANPASFSLIPSASSVVKGGSFTVSVYENGDNVNAVTTKLTFNSSLLQLNGTSCGGSFASSITETNGQTCFTAGGSTVNGNVLALNATFTALSTGSASVSIASGSKIVSSDTNTNIWNGAASATSVTVTAPATTPPTQPTTGGGSGSTSGSTGSSPSSTGSTSETTPTTNTSSTGSTPTQTTNGSTDSSATAGTAEVKSATDTKKTAASIVAAQSNDASKKAIWTIMLPFLIAFIVFIALTYPVILSNLKKAKITNFVRQKFAKMTGK
ncbi:MAG: hypothetical protein JWO99_708 [Candidatus Saccharibacteria bacterium]|nr:hypothetical protein [Candidatus Saccharibacteria bacterium]